MAGKKCPDGSVARLETVKIGGTTCTSLEALQRFFDRLTGDLEIITPPTFTLGSNHEQTRSTPSFSQRTKQHQESVRQQLDEIMGIKRCETCGAEINTGKCFIPKNERLWCPKCVVQRKSATLGLRIRIFRWSAQLSQLELSRRAGISTDNLRTYESDEETPSESQLNKLLTVLGGELVSGLKSSSEGGLTRPPATSRKS